MIFTHFLLIYFLIKNAKEGFIFNRTRGADVVRKADVARRTRTDAMRHATPCGRAVQAQAAPRWRVAVADAWQGHADAQGAPRGE